MFQLMMFMRLLNEYSYKANYSFTLYTKQRVSAAGIGWRNSYQLYTPHFVVLSYNYFGDPDIKNIIVRF